MEKSTEKPLKKRQTVLLKSHKLPLKKKTSRLQRREVKTRLAAIGTSVFIFFATLLLLAAIFLKHTGLISPLATQKEQVLAAAKKQDKDMEKIKSYLSEKKVAYATIERISDDSYAIRLKSGEEIIVSGDKDISKQLTSLQLILARLTMEGKQLLRLDLRYDKPVVQYKK